MTPYEFNDSSDKTTEIEETTQLDIYKQTRMTGVRALQEKTQFLKFMPFQNIEKYVLNCNTNSDIRDRLNKYFIMGVVTEKKVIAYSEKANKKYPTKKKESAYARFRMSDLSRYKGSLIDKIESYKNPNEAMNRQLRSMSEEEIDKVKAYKLMDFNADRYKSNDFILFGETAQIFSKNIKYGDLICILRPSVMEQKYNSHLCLSFNGPDQLLLIGKCSNYGICNSDKCSEFLNKNKHTKCVLHVEEDNDFSIKQIKAQRPNLRSSYVDSKKVAALRNHERKLEQQSKGYGFKRAKLEENDYMITPEQKQKLEKFHNMQETVFNKFVKKRNKKDSGVTILHKVKCTERDYIERSHNIEFDKVQPSKGSMMMELDSDGDSQ